MTQDSDCGKDRDWFACHLDPHNWDIHSDVTMVKSCNREINFNCLGNSSRYLQKLKAINDTHCHPLIGVAVLKFIVQTVLRFCMIFRIIK